MEGKVPVGIDVGFGETKFWSSDGKHGKFPSIVANDLTKVTGRNAIGRGPQSLEYKGKFYWIGDDAILMDHRPVTGLEGIIEYQPLFVRKVLQELKLKPSDTYAYLGLPPVQNYRQLRSQLIRHVNENIPDLGVDVSAQGVGVLADLEIDGTDVAVIDLGYNTAEVIIVVDRKVVPTQSISLVGWGVKRIIKNLESTLKRITGSEEITQVELLNALKTKRFKIDGKEHDISSHFKEIYESYRDNLFTKLDDEYHERFRRSSRIIITGGGAYFIKNLWDNTYKSRIIVPQQPEFSNARGFQRLATMALVRDAEKGAA